MKTAGMMMWIIGVALFAYAALAFDPSVEIEALGGRVANLNLLQQQTFMAMAGLGLFLAGIIFHAVGEAIETFRAKVAPITSPMASEIAVEKSGSVEGDTETMERYGITFDGEKYAFAQYRYDRLADAVAYAKRSAPKP